MHMSPDMHIHISIMETQRFMGLLLSEERSDIAVIMPQPPGVVKNNLA